MEELKKLLCGIRDMMHNPKLVTTCLCGKPPSPEKEAQMKNEFEKFTKDLEKPSSIVQPNKKDLFMVEIVKILDKHHQRLEKLERKE